ncbi:MAG: lipid A deacylase LpxR family protein [Bacteroidetes bacterium]|nr:lipid A deacylase LpxR family protein [Bacteroidota bacterium]
MNYKIFCLLLCFSCCAGAYAQSHSNEIGIETDDDSYLAQGSDRYYTAGTFLYFREGLSTKGNSKLQNKVLGFELGQKLYTPQSGSINPTDVPNGDDPRYIDRPFAAYLYVGSTLNLLYKDESNLKLSAQIGIIGPSALGRQTQQTIHNWFGLYHPSGWEYQIDNNAVLNLSVEYNRLLGRADWADISLASYANLGNGFTGAGIGPMIRLGDFNQLFNSESTQSTAIKSENAKPLHDHELFFYYKPQINLVLYDATVQGSMFGSKSPTRMEVTGNPETFVLSNQLGVGYSGKRFVIDAAVIFHSKDVKTQVQSEQWGDITLLYRFH